MSGTAGSEAAQLAVAMKKKEKKVERDSNGTENINTAVDDDFSFHTV